jgi:outer membrane immunogenic protein
MRRLVIASLACAALASGSAIAADMPLKAPAPPPPAWSWTGFYIGVQGGAGWGTSEDLATSFQNCTAGVCGPVTPFGAPGVERSTYTINGLHGGGTVGLNWQSGQIVFGVEADISGANIDGTGDCSESLGRSFNQGFTSSSAGCHTKLTWFGTAAGRLGVTIDHALLFVKAGGAWAHFDQDATMTTFVTNGPGSLTGTTALGTTRTGYMVGTGIEYALGSNWSAKVEYDFMDFGTKSLNFPFTGTTFGPVTVPLFADDRERVHVVRAGLNYRFNWGH